jgi:putative aldouronate transport system substrate-binding protein
MLFSLVASGLFAAGADDQAATDEKIVITMIPWTARGTTLAPDSFVELYLEERYNVDLQPWYDVDAYDKDARNVRIAAGDIPDWLSVWGGQTEWIDSGVVRPLPQDLIMKHMPNWMSEVEKYLGDAKWNATVFEGTNYLIPSAMSMASTGEVIGFRGDWMRAVGVEPKPVPDRDFFSGPDTIAEIESLLLKFRNEDPDGNGQKDTYGYMVWKNGPNLNDTLVPNVLGSYGIRLSTWDVRDGEGYYSMVDPNWKEALKFVNGWWEMEIFHPDTPTAVRADVVRSMANDEFGSWSELDAWMSNYNAGPWGALLEAHPDVDIVYSATPEGPTGKRGSWFRDPTGSRSGFGVNAEEDVMIKVMEMYEDIYQDADVYATNHYGGSEGETWQINPKGYRVTIPGSGSGKDAASGTLLGVRMFTIIPQIVEPTDKVYISPARHALQTYLTDTQVKYPSFGFRPNWSEDDRALTANIKTIENEFGWKAITGRIDIDAEWDGYVQSMMDAGLDRLLVSLVGLAK